MIARNNCSRSNEMSAHHRVKSPLTITEMRTTLHHGSDIEQMKFKCLNRDEKRKTRADGIIRAYQSPRSVGMHRGGWSGGRWGGRERWSERPINSDNIGSNHPQTGFLIRPDCPILVTMSSLTSRTRSAQPASSASLARPTVCVFCCTANLTAYDADPGARSRGRP